MAMSVGLDSAGSREENGQRIPMPLDVLGFAEIAYGTPADGEALWFSALVLEAFTIPGDAVSDLLFGFSKNPGGRALYANRGIPPHPSELVVRELQDDERFVASHGEGAFGHTYATLDEIEAVPWGSFGVDPNASAWSAVFAILDVMRRQLGASGDRLRVIVWATW